MRSAWSPTRSMSLETFFEVWPNCLLALPTVLATDFTSRSGIFVLPIERGSVTPRTFVRRMRLLRTAPPASPAAAAPTATAGPLALLAAFLSVPTMPLLLWLALLWLLPLWLLALFRLELAPLRELGFLRLEADDLERDEPPEERDEPPEEREEPLRDEALRDEALRDEAPRDEPLREPEDLLAPAFDPEPFDELLLLCPLREPDLLVAIP